MLHISDVIAPWDLTAGSPAMTVILAAAAVVAVLVAVALIARHRRGKRGK